MITLQWRCRSASSERVMPLRHETNRRLLLLIATVPAVIVGFVCYALAYAGYLLGTRLDSDPRLRDVMHRLDLAVVGLVAVGIAWLAWRPFRELRP